MTSATMEKHDIDLESVNQQLADRDAQQVVQWAVEAFGDYLVLSSSFGIQAAVMLHLATRVAPNIPVILIDTGYLFPETYGFVEKLTQRLNLNIKVYQPLLSPARHEALHGKEWEKDVDGLVRYNKTRKVEPMRRALSEFGAGGRGGLEAKVHWLRGFMKCSQ